MGDVLSIQVVAQHPPHYNRMLVVFKQLVNSEHVRIEAYDRLVDQTAADHLKAEISRTMARWLRQEHVRGRHEVGMQAHPQRDGSSGTEAHQKLRRFVNGDSRNPRCANHSRGCCSSRAERVRTSSQPA